MYSFFPSICSFYLKSKLFNLSIIPFFFESIHHPFIFLFKKNDSDWTTWFWRNLLIDWKGQKEKQSLVLAGIPSVFNEKMNQDQDIVTSIIENSVFFAVPKKKVTNARRKRKGWYHSLKLPSAFKECETCNNKHPPHILCPWCHKFNNWTLKKHKKSPFVTFL